MSREASNRMHRTRPRLPREGPGLPFSLQSLVSLWEFANVGIEKRGTSLARWLRQW